MWEGRLSREPPPGTPIYFYRVGFLGGDYNKNKGTGQKSMTKLGNKKKKNYKTFKLFKIVSKLFGSLMKSKTQTNKN